MTAPTTHPSPDELRADSQELLGYIANYLRAERARSGLSQDDIAARTGMSRAWVSKTETGNNNTLTALALYARACGHRLAFIVAQAEAAMDTVSHAVNSSSATR